MYHINKEITGSGENIALKNTAKHYFKDFNILGNGKQETRSGRNKADLSGINKSQISVSYVSNEDGSVKVSGTASADGYIMLKTLAINIPSETYVTMAYGSTKELLKDTDIKAFVWFYDASDNLVGSFNSSTFMMKDKYPTDIVKMTIGVEHMKSGTTYDLDLYIDIEISETIPTEYEQYGATPSIEFEAPVESVGDNIQLFDKEKATESCYVNMSTGNQVASSVSDTSDYIPILKDENYSISFEYETLLDSGARPICLYNTEKKYLSGSTYRITNKKVTITPSENGYLRFSYDKNCTNIKLSKGTSTGAYSPYGQGSIEIVNCNKNLLTKQPNVYYNPTGLTVTDKQIGEFILNGTQKTQELRFLDAYNTKKCNYELPKGTYKFCTYISTKEEPIYTELTISDGSSYQQINGIAIEFEITKEGQGLGSIKVPVSSGTYNNVELKMMLIKSTDDETYVPHQSQTKALYTQQPFRAIGDVKDRFVKQNGVCNEKHNIGRYIFTGNEGWKKSSRTDVNRYYVSNIINTILNASTVDIVCSHFKALTSSQSDTGMIGISKYNETGLMVNVDLTNTELDTLDKFKAKLTELYNAGTPVYVDYVLETPTLIPCTAEQVEVLEYFEKEAYSYDEATHIYSTDEVSPYFDVIAYQRISEEFKTRLKEGKITRGYLKVLATDTLPEIIINENNYLKDLKIEELRYVPEEGIIGGTVAKRVSGNFNNVDSSFDIQDREIEVYLGVELEDETTEYIKYGTYIVQRPEDDQVNDNTSFEALDYMIKFNQEYKDRITYPCTLKQLLDDIIDQAGVNSKVSTFANFDFVVENNQFEQGSTLRDVLKAITQIAFNWSRIDADDNLVMDFETREETDEELGIDDYFSFKKSDDYGPVNVIVLRNSQVEGENVTVKDEELINLPTNKNICPNDWIYGQYAPVDGSIGIYENRIRQKKLLKVKPNTEYYLNTFNDDYEIIIRTFLKDKTFSRNIGTLTPFMTNSEEYYIGVTIYSPSDNISALLELVNDNTIKPFICLNSEEDKTYIPFKAVGEIEYVISDNPFAYTELKRKQLIEAGKRLFGFKYTPMTVDMLGLMYLNAKDRISVENLNGQKYSTYLFDHTIDYTGIVLDSMESKSKSKTETKYQYVSFLAQGLSHVEIKVDKANKRIESIIESQEDVSEKVAKTVARIEVVYASSDSPTTAPTDGWSTTAPEWTAGKYMWQKTITTYANGSTDETAATNISGAKGEAGKNGIGITQTNITYQKSTSGTTVPTGTWQTTIPEVDEDGYLWTRTEFIYSDGSKKYAYNVGKKGATGIGVKSIIDQYYSSTSNTEVTGGEWKETQDTLQTDRFIWTRSKITWTNGSVTYTDPILANTLNDINSNIIVFKDFKASQESTNERISSKVEETTKKLNDEYLTADKVNEKIDKIDDDYTILESRVAQTELDSKSFKVSIETIQNTGVDKIKTSMGYTFNDDGLNIDRTGSDTSTVIDEAKIKVTDKTGGQPKSLLYAGYVKEGDTEFSDYEGQTIVATSNLIVQNFLIIGSNSRFQDYYNETLGGNGTGAFDI